MSRKYRMAMNGLALGVIASSALVVSGCGKKEDDTPPPPPPAPRAPSWTLADIDMDHRVTFPASSKPESKSLAVAAADLASAMVRGDRGALRGLISSEDAEVIGWLEDEGQWDAATGALTEARICILFEDTENGFAQFGLGLSNGAGAFLLGWEGTQSGDSWSFSAVPIQDRTAATASALDGTQLPYFVFASAADKGTGGGGTTTEDDLPEGGNTPSNRPTSPRTPAPNNPAPSNPNQPNSPSNPQSPTG